ncbi:MAG: hypothetical protein M3256_19885 [Actinomycetota bacterium]|nr:hypothetical protein [Actinomycetota bacterium]
MLFVGRWISTNRGVDLQDHHARRRHLRPQATAVAALAHRKAANTASSMSSTARLVVGADATRPTSRADAAAPPCPTCSRRQPANVTASLGK